MTPSNIASWFCATGVCPFNRSAIMIPGIGDATEEPSALLKTTRLAFIPLFSPAHPQKPKTDGDIDKPFTDKEKQCFQIRYENGYDLTTDKRYNRWLRINHPEESHHILEHKLLTFSDSSDPGSLSEETQQVKPTEKESACNEQKPNGQNGQIQTTPTTISELLILPTVPAKLECTAKGGKARVLTSKECLEQLEEKERQKQEQEQLKKEKRKEKERGKRRLRRKKEKKN